MQLFIVGLGLMILKQTEGMYGVMAVSFLVRTGMMVNRQVISLKTVLKSPTKKVDGMTFHALNHTTVITAVH